MNTQHGLKLVLEKLAAIPIDQNRSEIEWCLRDAYDLTSHGDWGVALENLCENLYEWDFPLTKEIFNDIQCLANQWGLKPHYIEIIKELLD